MSTAALTLEQFLQLHPFPKAYEAQKRMEWFWHFDVAASADLVWPLVADTSRMNRELEVSEMKFAPRADGALWGTSNAGGVHHEWIEVPWNWVAGQWLESCRLYQRGFSKVLCTVFHLEPLTAGGTRVYCYFGSVPRGLIGAVALRIGFAGFDKSLARVFSKFDQLASQHVSVLSVPRRAPLTLEGETRLRTIAEALHGQKLDRACIEALVSWVRTGDDDDLLRIQVPARARAWGVDEDALLRVCLHATRAGLLDLSWDAVCPHCRGAVQANATLGDLKAKADCALCAIEFGTDSPEAVEITFHVHPSVRDVPRKTFCSAETASKSHIRVQRAVAPGSEVVVAPSLTPGRYRMRLSDEKRYGYLDVGGGQQGQIDWLATAPVTSIEAAAAPTVRIVNDSARERRFILETARWTDFALRPGKLLSFQEFRDLFSDEYLSADVQLAIGEQTIMFTDMVGSTAMYAQRGDPAAFLEVKRHFSDVFAIIARHRGAVVKTIGDAAMGAFNNPLDALKASQEIHQCFHPNRTDVPSKLRITLNTGPCIAVKLNTSIDYFGHTVNVAAKLQGLAEAWQISMSDAVYGAPGVAAWLKEQGVTVEALAYASKAIPEPIGVKRWSVFASP